MVDTPVSIDLHRFTQSDVVGIMNLARDNFVAAVDIDPDFIDGPPACSEMLEKDRPDCGMMTTQCTEIQNALVILVGHEFDFLLAKLKDAALQEKVEAWRQRAVELRTANMMTVLGLLQDTPRALVFLYWQNIEEMFRLRIRSISHVMRQSLNPTQHPLDTDTITQLLVEDTERSKLDNDPNWIAAFSNGIFTKDVNFVLEENLDDASKQLLDVERTFRQALKGGGRGDATGAQDGGGGGSA